MRNLTLETVLLMLLLTKHKTAQIRSDEAHPSRQREREQDEDEQRGEDGEERDEIIAVHEWDFDVHPEETTDQVERDEHRSDHGDLAEDLVGVRALGDIVDG